MKSIKNKLTLATCSLLSQQSGNALALENAWEIDSSFFYYAEEEQRVSVAKFVVNAAGDVTDRDRVSIQSVLDTISGSTPSGAVQSNGGGGTVSGASGGGGSGVSNPNASALAKISDTRLGNAINWTHQHENNWTVDYNAAVSIENDYRSFSGAATVNKETVNKDYRFTLGIAGTLDEIYRVGGGDTPAPLTQLADGKVAGEGEKDTIDAIFGISHVINRRTVVQANLSYSQSKGYLTDPYKVFSVVDRETNTIIDNSSYTEGRPGSRTRKSITLRMNHQTFPANNVLGLSYRYYTDDWEVDSHTVDTSYRFNLADTNYIEPRLRLYTQTKAFFYQNQFFVDDAGASDPSLNFPKYLSADYRLDDMTSITPGIRYGRQVGKDGHLRARLEYMMQSFKASEFDTNRAIIFQIAYSQRF